ncbi:hypothetical protein B0H12DRAFT_1238399 [Mycena haematopus]|nr:hypothetical protein B0H12DRAFT_1238399 [Mycena haematopus]
MPTPHPPTTSSLPPVLLQAFRYYDNSETPLPRYSSIINRVVLDSTKGRLFIRPAVSGWSIDPAFIEAAVASAKAGGTTAKALVVIDPGNPGRAAHLLPRWSGSYASDEKVVRVGSPVPLRLVRRTPVVVAGILLHSALPRPLPRFTQHPSQSRVNVKLPSASFSSSSSPTSSSSPSSRSAPSSLPPQTGPPATKLVALVQVSGAGAEEEMVIPKILMRESGVYLGLGWRRHGLAMTPPIWRYSCCLHHMREVFLKACFIRARIQKQTLMAQRCGDETDAGFLNAHALWQPQLAANIGPAFDLLFDLPPRHLQAPARLDKKYRQDGAVYAGDTFSAQTSIMSVLRCPQGCVRRSGQIVVDSMIPPPKECKPSYALWKSETYTINTALVSRTRIMRQHLEPGRSALLCLFPNSRFELRRFMRSGC